MHGAKFVAVWFISLIAGAEVAEGTKRAAFEEGRRAFERISKPYGEWADVEKEWTLRNQVCRGRCGDSNWPMEGGSSQCVLRPLAGDKAGESCRLTDEYMLSNGRANEFMALHTGLLMAKAEKYAAQCNRFTPRRLTHVCPRRAQHMVEAITFIGKAKQRLGEEEALGEDHEDVLGVAMSAMAGGSSESLRNLIILGKTNRKCMEHPQICNKNVLTVMHQLLRNGKEARAKAKAAIEAGTALDPTPQQLAELEKMTAPREAAWNDEVVQEILAEEEEEVDELVQKAIESVWDDDDTSLIQVDDQGDKVDDAATAISWAIMITLVILLIFYNVWQIIPALISWTVLTLVGCGVYIHHTYGHYSLLQGSEVKEIAPTTTVRRHDSVVEVESQGTTDSRAMVLAEGGPRFPWEKFGGCVARMFVFPFVIVFKLGRYLYKMVS